MLEFKTISNKLIVKDNDIKRLYEVCTFVDAEATHTTFGDSIKVSIIDDNVDKTKAMIKFADEHYDDICKVIYESSFVFADIYRNPEILQLYLNRSDVQKKELKTKDSMRKAIDKYNSKFAEIKIRIDPNVKEKIKAKAKQNGMSVQAYIIDLIEKDIN